LFLPAGRALSGRDSAGFFLSAGAGGAGKTQRYPGATPGAVQRKKPALSRPESALPCFFPLAERFQVEIVLVFFFVLRPALRQGSVEFCQDYRARLEAGKPCPLCGSCEHPAIEQYASLTVTDRSVLLNRWMFTGAAQRAGLTRLKPGAVIFQIFNCGRNN
jgi:hypothetical protein